MTRGEVRKIVEGITDEQLKSILDLHSSGISKAKADGEKFKSELDTANKRIEIITAELDGLMESNVSAEDWKSKYEEFKANVDAEKAEAKLGLKVNAEKTKVTPLSKLKYLGFGFCKDKESWKARPHNDSVAKFKRKLKELCKRKWSIDLTY